MENLEVNKEKEELINEIESHYGLSLTEIVLKLSSKPIVQHFKGTYYSVVGIAQSCDTETPVVIYKPLTGGHGAYWTRDLLDFLSPVPEKAADKNVTGQTRRFAFIDKWQAQLSAVSTEDLVAEVNNRSEEVYVFEKKDIVAEDWVIARVLEDVENSKLYIQNIINYYNTGERAEEAYNQYIRKRRIKGDTFKIIHRIYSF